VKTSPLKIALAVAVGCLMPACNGKKETISSQSNRNWVDADPAAITAAKMEPARNIHAKTHLAAGRLHESQGALGKAAEQYQLALAGDAKNVGAMNRLAIVNARMGRFKEAQRSLKRAIKLEPNAAVLRNNLGYAHLCSKNWTQAEDEFRQAIRLNPHFHRARINLAIAVGRQDRLEESLEMFRRSLPEPDAFYNLGLVLKGMKRYQDAANAFELALDHNPDFPAAKRQLAQLTGEVDQRSVAVRKQRDWQKPSNQPNAQPQTARTHPSPVQSRQPQAIAVAQPAATNTTPSAPRPVAAQPQQPVQTMMVMEEMTPAGTGQSSTTQTQSEPARLANFNTPQAADPEPIETEPIDAEPIDVQPIDASDDATSMDAATLVESAPQNNSGTIETMEAVPVEAQPINQQPVSSKDVASKKNTNPKTANISAIEEIAPMQSMEPVQRVRPQALRGDTTSTAIETVPTMNTVEDISATGAFKIEPAKSVKAKPANQSVSSTADMMEMEPIETSK
jgi:Flp pilus assembly protein TadD